MSSNIGEIEGILQEKLAAYRELELVLKEVNGDRNYSAWGLGRMEKINDLFAKLKEIDCRQDAIINSNSMLLPGENYKFISGELKMTIIRVRDLVTTYRMRLKGGQETVAQNLRQVVKGASIKGYKAAVV